MGQHNDRLSEMLNLLAPVSEKIPKDPLFHVKKIGGPARESALIQAFQSFRMTAHNPADGVFRGVPLISNQTLDFPGQRGVFNHQGMGAEDGAILSAQLFRDGFLVLPSLGGRGRQRFAKPRYLFIDAVFTNRPLRNPEQLRIQHEGWTDGHAGRDRNSAFDFHMWSEW